MSKSDPYKYFMIEADELLENIQRDILYFEKEQNNPETLKRLFRYAHTLKGAAHVVGLANIGTLSHSIEDLFSKARDKNALLSEDDFSLILETLEIINNIIATVKEGKPEDSIDILPFLKRFDVEESQDKIMVKKAKDLPSNEEKLEEPVPEPAELPEVSTEKELLPLPGKQPDLAPQASGNDQARGSNESIRVMLSDVDSLMDQASELISSTARMEQLHALFKQNVNAQACSLATGSGLVNHSSLLDVVAEEMKQLSDNLYQIIYKIRSTQVGSLSHYFKAAVRDLSIKLNKQISLGISGEELEIDRNLLDEIKEPLNQLIRNACTHGIEEKDERAKKGKDQTSHIELAFEKQGDFVHIHCKDDGRGIDPQKIKNIALKKGLINKAMAMELNRDKSLALIFKSGLSSGKIITEFAGRGVGLDIVRDKIELLRGTISLDTVEDQFTHFSMIIPLSLNITNTFLIQAAGQQFLIPLHMVIETGYLPSDTIKNAAGEGIANINNLPTPIIHLDKILGITNQTSQNKLIPYVLLKAGHETGAFAVDQLLGVRRIAIRDLDQNLNEIKFYTGGSILGDGLPVLVLNVMELFNVPRNQYKSEEISAPDEENEGTSQRILAVDDSLSSRMLISSILEQDGYDVTLANSAEDALNLLLYNNYNLIISDVEMPGLNGFELAEKIRKGDDEHRETPIIIISSLAKDEHKRKGIEVGAQAYIVKGDFDQGIFLETVERLI